jgi:hypothetical protein
LVLRLNQKTHHRFEVKPRETVTTGFEIKLGKTVATDFEAKSDRSSGFEANPLTNRRPWFLSSTKKPVLLVSTCTVQTAHSVTRPPDHLVTE